MTFVRRSRRGKLHVVRERVANSYARLSKGLMRANQGVVSGVWNVHKGLQLGLAKGHQAIQSGLKTVQDFTGDFSMYQQRNSYYQYQEPVAMFSMAEVEKYNKYEKGDHAQFADYYGPALGPNLAKKTSRLTNAKGAVYAGYKKAGGAGKKALGLAGRVPAMAGGATAMGLGYASQGAQAVGSGLNKLGTMAAMNPRIAGALLAGTAAAGAGGAMFLRRRRTKKGKIVVEQVRR